MKMILWFVILSATTMYSMEAPLYGSVDAIGDEEDGNRFIVVHDMSSARKRWCKRRDLETYKQDRQIATLAGIAVGPVVGFVAYSVWRTVWESVGIGVAGTVIVTGIFHGCARCVRNCEEMSDE